MKVTVTAAHIERGKRRAICLCPIALAILEQRRLAVGELEVLGDRVVIGTADEAREVAALPPIAYRFIERFDNAEAVGPIEFDLTWREFKP